MLINDNGVTREATPEEEEKYSVIDPQPETDIQQKSEAFDYLTGRSDDND